MTPQGRSCSADGCTGSVHCKGMCKRHYQAAYHAANRERNNAVSKAYREAHRAELNARQRAARLVEGDRLRAAERAYNEANREKRAAYMREYRKANSERVNAWIREWGQRNLEYKLEMNRARRVRLAGNGVFVLSARDRRRLDSTMECQHCYARFTADNPRNIDHIVPVSRGGGHRIGNIWALCQRCNFAKHSALYAEFRYRAGRHIKGDESEPGLVTFTIDDAGNWDSLRYLR